MQALPKGAHWFCPRLSPNDTSDYSEGEDGDAAAGDADKRDHARKVDKAKQRQSLALNCMQIIAFDGSDAESLKQEYQKDLDLQLGRCDACVKSYYRALPGHLESLESDFDADAVEAFRQTVNNMNIARIVKGLNAIKKELLALPPEKRGVGSLDQAGCLAIFEPLCCAPFLHDENLLQKYFDEPFKLVQTKKRLKMTYFTPAITSFLFSSSEDRYNWAYTTAVRYKKPLTQLDFDWSIRDFLHEAAERVNISNVDKDFLPAFWNGARLLIGKLDKDLITHSLRAMDSDIYRLALEHLQIDSEGFLDLVGTLQLLLLKAPNDFWDAMGAISPVTIVEQIFNAPAVERIACETGRNGSTELDDLQDILLWVEPFLASIKAINRVSACRALVHQLILRFQTNRYSQLAKDYCYTLGLRVLDETLRSLLESQSSKNPISEATISEVLEVVEQQIPSICADIRSLRASTTRTDAAQLGLQIIQHAISLDCRVLKVDFERVNSKQPLQHHKNTKSAALWQSITQNITKKDSELAIIVLLGCRELTGLEPMVVPNGKHMSSDWRHFNETFDRICGYVADVLEKVTDFPERDLRALLQNLNKASALFATLFSANREVQEGALEVLKAASGQTGRRETLDFVLHNSFSTALSMTSNYLRVAAKRKVFAPMPRALKICDDLVDILCNSQDGILRSRELTSEESRVTRDFWQAFWQALSSIFEYTEDWSTQGHPKDVLKDFCRDAMQVGERLFDEYAIFTTAIKRSGKNESASSTESDLLQHPKLATKGLVKWLRLRDEYLSSKSVSLVCKLLVRFHDEAVDLNETELTYIESIMDGSTRSALSGQQSAELKSALEAHTGQPFDDDEEVLPAKASSTRLPVKGQRQGQLDLNLWKATAASRGSPAISSEAESDDDDLAKVREKTSAGVELAKARLEQKKLDSQRRQVALSNRAPPQPPVNVLDIRARRKAEKEAKERRDAAAREHARKVRGQADEANGAGSGILGIGVRGKEEVPKGEGMYVSDESSDEDDMDKELFGITKNAKATKAPELSAQERALRQLPQVPVKKKKIIRTAKDMRARIAPDLSSLHQSILGWEYFATGDFPPGSRTDIYSQVPNKFPSPVHYQQVFQPLLELEAWQGFVKSREENNFKAYEIKISNRSSVDAFVEVSTTMTHADNKDIQIGEGDVILMSKDKSPANAIDVPHCLARVFRITRKKAFLEILYRVVPGNPLLNGLVPNSSVYGVKVQSMTPLEREYGALKSLQYYDLCDEIVSAKPSPLLKYNDRLLEPLIKNYNVNKAQAKAVQSAVDNDAFTLIQG